MFILTNYIYIYINYLKFVTIIFASKFLQLHDFRHQIQIPRVNAVPGSKFHESGLKIVITRDKMSIFYSPCNK